MRNPIRHLLAWTVAGLAAVAVTVWAYPRALPFFPFGWQVNKAEATHIALDRFRDLGKPVDDGLVVTSVNFNSLLERRFLLRSMEMPLDKLKASRIADELVGWRVTAYPPNAASTDWICQARVSPAGRVTSIVLRVPPDEGGGALEPAEARERADAFLSRLGFDLSRFEPASERSQQQLARTDLSVRYRERGALFGEGISYGVQVDFAGEQLVGFRSWLDDPNDEAISGVLRYANLLTQAWVLLALPLVPLVGIAFVRRYHAGEIGVRRGLQIFAVAVGLGTVGILLVGHSLGEGWNFGSLPRWAVTPLSMAQLLVLFFFPSALMALLSWSVGEAINRERTGQKLAALDSVFQGNWSNSTVARSAWIGLFAGLTLAALQLVYPLPLRSQEVWHWSSWLFGPWWIDARFWGLSLIAIAVSYALYTELFGRLLLTSALTRRFGTVAGSLWVALISAIVFFPAVAVIPLGWSMVLWVGSALFLIAVFLRYGILTALLTQVTARLFLSAYPFLFADDASLVFQASIATAALLVPVALSCRHLLSGEEFIYRWDDVPAHVRRITERERQRVELETARGIQSSILPDLPPQLAGVELAHAYLPATEVGGDFYDVLALEDGRLAVAIGDVAGHGVSSGLVMSMAKSALAVQVTFDPEVDAVFRTLNRVVYQGARKRLLATLCYALLDPARRELEYASAGHLFPYVVKPDARVQPLEFIAYPLGVRGTLSISARRARLDPGDTLFLLSDGLVEARPEGSEDLFGFDRLEHVLSASAHLGVSAMRDAVVRAVDQHSAGAPREDDQTVLVLRIA